MTSRGKPARPTLLVLAGVNGAGKSSVAGAWLRDHALDYYNPDEATARLRKAGVDDAAANAAAWEYGRRALLGAIERGGNFAIETTLGGNTLPALIRRACDTHNVTLWFVGLDTPERHLSRIRVRVKRGGHDIPEAKVRQRWEASRRNLIALMPHLFELRVYDNSTEVRSVAQAEPVLLLHLQRGRIKAPGAKQLERTPEWAKSIVEAARQWAQGLIAAAAPKKVGKTATAPRREDIACYALVADAKDDAAARFYAKYGFQPCIDEHAQWYLPLGKAL